MKSFRHCAVLILAVLSLLLVAGAGPVSASTTTYDSTDVPVPISDFTTVTSTITVPSCDAAVVDVNVTVNIPHTCDGVLNIFLIAPDGTAIDLATALAVSCGAGGFLDTTFDDEAAVPITPGTSPFTGTFRPEGLLSALDGKSAAGTWTLRVQDPDGFGDTGSIDSWSLTITTNGNTLPSADVPKALPDLATTTSTITSCNTGTILDLNVRLDITHTFDGDLDIFLIAPDGTRIELSTDNGGGGDNYSGTIFDDEAATPITAGAAPFAGSFQPETPLSVLDNMGADGVWTLEITDDLGADVGTLNSWSLILTTVASGYTVSTYASGLPSVPAGLTVDQRTRTFYFADNLSCEGVLRKIAPDGTVSTVTTDFTPNGDGTCSGFFYPFVQTDIQFLNGSVYVPLSDIGSTNGELVRINTTTGGTTTVHAFTGFGFESGIVAKNGSLLVTSGQGPATEIQSYNPGSDTAAVVLDVSPLTSVFNVEYDPAKDATYFWSGGVFHRANLGAGSFAAIPVYASGYADFAVSPDGNSLFTANHPGIDIVTIADGSAETVFNGLSDGTRHDMALAPSSTSGGCSLYVADGTSILEISGFPGTCKSFPWIMFLPAITH